MAHLVNNIDQPLDASLSVLSVLEHLRDAHQYLVQLGVIALRSASERDVSTSSWGTQTKRVKIVFPDRVRPSLVSGEHNDHSLTEVINQCATMERLIDALVWANKNLPDYQLVRCHPTTSSQKAYETDIPDNDIVLINSEGRLAQFEVSDVSGDGDSNRKEPKDLKSLGVRLKIMKDYPLDKHPFINRLFMVVSVEMGERLRHNRTDAYHERYQPYFQYQEHDVDGQTCIFEVLSR